MRIGNWSIGAPASFTALAAALQRAMTPLIKQLNATSEGQIAGASNASTSPPAAGSALPYAQGDFIRNSKPQELGVAGAKYVVFGWSCVAAGSPGTWVACRFLTGN